MIKAVLFDCDGTLVDSEYAHFLAWRFALQNQGGDLTLEEYYDYVGKSLYTNARLFAQKIGSTDEKALLDDKHRHYEHAQKNGITFFQETVNFFIRLNESKQSLGILLGVVSAAGTQEIQRNLESLGLLSMTNIVLSGLDDLGAYSDPEGVNKPKPYIYLEAAKRLGVLPSECLVIEDSEPGIIAAKDAGCLAIAIPNSFTRNQDFLRADKVIETFREVSEIVLAGKKTLTLP